MPWQVILASSLDSTAPESLAGYLLGYGPVGVFLVALAWLLFRGWRLMSPSDMEAMQSTSRNEARADLIEARGLALEDKKRAEEKADEALRIAQTQIAPLLLQFNGTVTALIPLLQDLVSRRESREREIGRP